MSRTIEGGSPLENLRREVKLLRERVKVLEGIVFSGKPYVPGQAELDRAIEAAAFQGDVKPLDEYLRRGGRLPDPEEEPVAKKVQTKQKNECGNPRDRRRGAIK